MVEVLQKLMKINDREGWQQKAAAPEGAQTPRPGRAHTGTQTRIPS